MPSPTLNHIECISCHQASLDNWHKIERYCNCYYHQSCLTRIIQHRQQTHCPNCRESFQKTGLCRIVKQVRPFMDFFCTPGAFALLTIFLMVFSYGLQFLLIITTSYSMASAMNYSKIAQIIIFIPGIIYDFYYILCLIITISIMITLFRFWREENPIIVIEWIPANTTSTSTSTTTNVVRTQPDVPSSSSSSDAQTIPIIVTSRNKNPNRSKNQPISKSVIVKITS